MRVGDYQAVRVDYEAGAYAIEGFDPDYRGSKALGYFTVTLSLCSNLSGS